MGKSKSKEDRTINPEKAYQFQKLYCLVNSLRSESERFQTKCAFWIEILKQSHKILGEIHQKIKKIEKENKFLVLLLKSFMRFHEQVGDAISFSIFYQAYLRASEQSDLEDQFEMLEFISRQVRGGDEILKHHDLLKRAIESSMNQFVIKIGEMEEEEENIGNQVQNLIFQMAEYEMVFKTLRGFNPGWLQKLLDNFEDFFSKKIDFDELLSIVLDRKLPELSNEKDRIVEVFEACCKLEGITKCQKIFDLGKKFDKTFYLKRRIQKFEKIEEKIDLIIDLFPKIEKLNHLSKFFEEKGIEVNSKGCRAASHYVLLNCEELNYSLSNMLKFSKLKNELDSSENDYSVYEFEPKFDFESSIKESLHSMIETTNLNLSTLGEYKSKKKKKIIKVSNQISELKTNFLEFGNFLKNQIFSTVQFVDRIELCEPPHRIPDKTNFVEKGVQASQMDPFELDFYSFYSLKELTRRQIIRAFYHQVIKRRSVGSQTIESSRYLTDTFQNLQNQVNIEIENKRALKNLLKDQRVKISQLNSLLQSEKNKIQEMVRKTTIVEYSMKNLRGKVNNLTKEKLQLNQLIANQDATIRLIRKKNKDTQTFCSLVQTQLDMISVGLAKIYLAKEGQKREALLSISHILMTAKENLDLAANYDSGSQAQDLYDPQTNFAANQLEFIHRFTGEEGYFKIHARFGWNNRSPILVASSHLICSEIGNTKKIIKNFNSG